jgi:predicted RNase H-like HicB family nuclease
VEEVSNSLLRKWNHLHPSVDVRVDNAIIIRMELQNFRMVITWSDEDQAYTVEVPELPGCMADGKTRFEAVDNAEIIIQEWLETSNLLNRLLPLTPES